jgi:hypothetical protein
MVAALSCCTGSIDDPEGRLLVKVEGCSRRPRVTAGECGFLLDLARMWHAERGSRAKFGYASLYSR